MPDEQAHTTLRVSVETWRQLQQRKQEPGDTIDDVIQELVVADGTSES